VSTSTLGLLAARRFGPLCATQALSAFNDNLVKNALVVLALFRLGEGGAGFTALAGALFIAPYALLSATAGQLADRFPKPRLIVINKATELVLMAFAAAGFLLGNVTMLLIVLAGLGAQVALFSPQKYGSLPEHLAGDELVAGNGLIEATTFVAIVIGTVAGGGLMLLTHGAEVVASVGLIAAVIGFITALRIPQVAAAAPDLRIGPNPLRETWRVLGDARQDIAIWRCMLGLSWFWVLGATVLTLLPVVVRDVIRAPGEVLTLALAIFAIGVGAGSIACARLLHGDVSPRHVPIAALGMAVFLFDFSLAAEALGRLATPAGLLDLAVRPQAWRAAADLALLAACGGAFSVPLYAIVQKRAPREACARMVAANNILNAVAMVFGAGAVAALSAIGLAAHVVLAIAAAADFVVTIIIVEMIPREVWRMVLRWVFGLFYRADVRGLEHCREAGERVVVVANHLSYGDAALLASYLPGRIVFAIHSSQMNKWWVRFAVRLVEVFPIDVQSAYAIKRMVAAVRDGKILVLFPEGRLTRTGALMKVYEGAGLVADKADAKVLPVVIEGFQFSPLGKMKGKLPLRWFPPLSMVVLPPVDVSPDPARTLTPRQRREVVGRSLQDIMVNSVFQAKNIERSLFTALLDARARHGGKTVACEDLQRVPMTHDRLLLGACALGRQLASQTRPRETVGIMLPNTNVTAAALVGLLAFDRVPAMLNYSAGAEAMLNACIAAEVRTVVCSRTFVERGRLEAVAARMQAQLRFIWLEDVRESIAWKDRLRAKRDAIFARRLPGAATRPEAPAVVLFTSGSEGTPKGVVLSHRNLLANCAQIASVIDFSGADKVFAALPVFHAFGFVGGLMLPLLSGVATFQYPSPLHYRIVSNMIYDSDSTIVFGTDTFLNGWARFAHPYDFYAVRYVCAGAERVREETRRLFADRFGTRVLEGYGVTETSPVLALNTAMHSRPGTVGRFLPGIEWALDPVPGIEGGGRLRVRGPNVMLGYVRASNPGAVEPPLDGWYDTGDIVSVDADGYATIRGRAKRFAKIGGEMVSMPAAEALIEGLWPDEAHAVVALPDARKGEQLVLVTTRASADLREILERAHARGVPEIMVPRLLLHVESLPLLATGKPDYPAVQRMAEAALADGRLRARSAA
jgi:acyl-[acyl-carrier-protein]-phospholipid O-acyltransferase / long-chain-fatty-acid--[acyl-carrier-protein] ligase